MTAPLGILLVHGAWHGPWCWDNFVDYLSRRGHDVRTVQLRGHTGQGDRIWYRLHHYVEDVQRAAAEFSAPPILVGHSLGGLLVQQYLERHPALGSALVASIPPRGTAGTIARLTWHHPMAMVKSSLLLRLKPFIGSRRLVRELFFTSSTPQEIVDHCFMHVQDESYLAIIDTMIGPSRPRHTHVPVLVLGAERDAFFTLSEVRQTAWAYGTEAHIFPGMGHDMMLDQGWQKVAEHIDGWTRLISSAQGRR